MGHSTFLVVLGFKFTAPPVNEDETTWILGFDHRWTGNCCTSICEYPIAAVLTYSTYCQK